MGMQKTGILERKALILLSLTILTLILTTTLATPTLAKMEVVSVEKDENGKTWVTIAIYNGKGELVKIITFDPPGGGPGFPDE
ncbi:MAG: hypothetical protein LM601_10935 [Candidatus Verstraetearchaeota archaeon]|nr:hypothetical protein [Candidatus Verstraetearchaeota archaeon]